MAKPVSYADIFDFSNPSDLNQAIKALNSLLKVYDSLIKKAKTGSTQIKASQDALVKSLNGIIEATKKLDETQKADQKTTQETNAQAKALSATYEAQKKQITALESQVKKLTKEKTQVAKKTQDVNNINKEAIKLEAQLGKLSGQSAKETAALKLQIQEKRKALAAEAKEAAGRVSLYQKESTKLNDLRNKYKNVALAQGQNSKAARDLLAQITPLDNKLKQLDATVGQGQRGVGLYSKSILGATRQIAGALGFTGAIFALVGAMKSAFNTVKTFQKQNAVLAGVLNKSRSEITELTEDSKRLGATTAKSATEVSKLQIAYARLGFSQQEILNLTGDTIDGSIALNAELDETAELTGAMVRTFNDLKTTDASKILDTLAKSTQLSALNFQKLQTALPIVSGAANAAGISFERTVSLLGKLSDAGIDASSSATALRNIFIESAAQGLNYEEILDKISNSQDKLTAANDEFGKRAAVSGTILANLTDEVEEFNDELLKAGGTAKKVAEENLNTLEGKITLLSSAWQGLIFSIESGDGALSNFAEGIVTTFTEQISIITAANDSVVSWGEAFLSFVDPIQNAMVQTKIRLAALTEEHKKQQEAIEQEKIQNELNRDALLQYDTAVKSGIKTYKEFVTIHGDFFTESERDKTILGIIKQRFDDVTSSIKKTNDEFKVIIKSMSKFSNDAERTFVKDLSELLFGDTETIKEGLDRNVELVSKSLDQIAERTQKARKEELEAEQKAAEKKALIQQTAFESASIIGNQLFENGRINRENELADLQRQKNYELELAGDNADARARIAEEFARKEKKIRVDGAKAARRQALFNIALTTAQAIIAALAPPPTGAGPIAGIPFAIAAGALGAVQAAAVISQPLPSFEKGGIVETDGSIITSEKGREMAVTPKGKLILTGNKGAEIRNDIPKGSAILTNPITEKILKGGFDHEQINNDASFKINQILQEQRDSNTQRLVNAMQRENDILIASLGKKIDKMPHDIFNVSDGDLKRLSVKGNTKHNEWRSKNKM